MSRRTRIGFVVALVLALAGQAAAGRPARAAAELRAVGCCAKRCHKAQPVSRAADCCGVEQAPDDQATLAPATAARAPVVAVLPAPALAGSSTPSVSCASLLDLPPHRAGPIFRLIRSLRI